MPDKKSMDRSRAHSSSSGAAFKNPSIRFFHEVRTSIIRAFHQYSKESDFTLHPWLMVSFRFQLGLHVIDGLSHLNSSFAKKGGTHGHCTLHHVANNNLFKHNCSINHIVFPRGHTCPLRHCIDVSYGQFVWEWDKSQTSHRSDGIILAFWSLCVRDSSWGELRKPMGSIGLLWPIWKLLSWPVIGDAFKLCRHPTWEIHNVIIA